MDSKSKGVAVITGGARGIGRATALRLVRDGYKVALADRLRASLEETAAAVAAAGGEALILEGDVADFASVQGQAAEVDRKLGPVDVLVNNAGISQPKGILDISEAEWDLTIAINLKGYFNWCKAVAAGMYERQAGRIVNISSVSAQAGAAPTAVSKFAYGAAKAGILGLTRGLARELAPHVLVNAICPGAIWTDLTSHKFALNQERMLQQIPLKRVGTPEDIAEVVAFLAAASPMFITGEIIDVDGGQYIN